jgi:hypothetical protein
MALRRDAAGSSVSIDRASGSPANPNPGCRVRIARPAAWGVGHGPAGLKAPGARRSQPPCPQRLNAQESIELRLRTHSYVVRTMNGWRSYSLNCGRGRWRQIGRQRSRRSARRGPEAPLVSGHQGLEGSDPAARGEILQQRQFIGDAALAGSVGHATPIPQRRHWLQSNRGYMSNSGQRRRRSLWSGSCRLWQSLSTPALRMDSA